jgi:hypothetical protein
MHAQGGIKGEEKGNKGIDLAFVERLCGLREAVCESGLGRVSAIGAVSAVQAVRAVGAVSSCWRSLVPVSAR